MHKNQEGYPDPTAGAAIRKADSPPENIEQAIQRMKTVARWHEAEVVGRIILRDKKTGRVWP